MEISGHKTRAIFDRDHAVSDRRMQENAAKLEAYLKGLEANVTGNTEGEDKKRGMQQPV